LAWDVLAIVLSYVAYVIYHVCCLQDSTYGAGLYTFQQNEFMPLQYFIEDVEFASNVASSSGAISLEFFDGVKVTLSNVTCIDNTVREILMW
jgi:hypothetical protein